MTDSLRKKVKSKHTPNLVIVGGSEVGNPLRFMSTHPRKPQIFDATVFAEDREKPEHAHGWDKGGHQGRPKLTAEIMPFIKRRYLSAPEKTLGHLNASMRSWWRLFDKYEDIRRVEVIDDIDEFVHGALAIKEGFTNGANPFLIVLNDALKERGQHPLDIKLPRPTPLQTSVPEQAHINLIAKELTRRVRKMFANWETFDTMVNEMNGWVLDETQWKPTHSHGRFDERHAHCAYRQACSELKNPVLRRSEFVAWLGLSNTENYNNPFVGGFSAATTVLYPTRQQSTHLLYLFLCKTGWNLETALDIDVDDYWRPHPTNPAFAIIYATKDRANGEYQRAASELKPKLSAYNLLMSVISRTEPLRNVLKDELTKLEKLEDERPGEIDEKALQRINELRRCIQSPWLHVVMKEDKPVSALNNRVIYEAEQRLSTLIAEINACHPEQEKINTSLTIGDFRDAYISAQYRRSNYSWIVAQLAAGHKSTRSLVTYLRKRQWKAHGEKVVQDFTDAMWTEIRVTNAVDPAILRGLVQRGEITEDQRKRWANHKDRTRVGTGCKDFKNPPKEVAPEHSTGSGCRVQRCTLCRHAVVFDDSMDPLARRLAQLLLIKESVPLPSWHSSSWPLEAEATEKILFENWDKSLVDSRINYWKKAESAGVHLLMEMEGEYGA